MKNKKALLASLLLFSIVFFSGFGCKQEAVRKYTVNLEVWGLFDSADVYQEIFNAYKGMNPNVGEITYKKMSQETYRDDLIRAMAKGQGPDIFMIHSRWVPDLEENIYPAPTEVIWEQKFRSSFVDVAADDFLFQGVAYGVPLSVDSLGLYYNKDLFNAAGITEPPKNWDEFVDFSRKLTRIDEHGQIVQSGAAMGTASNINRATDILTLLMFQNKAEIVDRSSMQVRLNERMSDENGNSFSPGENALAFYTQFANQNSTSIPYTWNSRLHYSIDAFSEGTLGMMFNYSWQTDALALKSPKLNYAVAPVPQFEEGKANVANYWGYTVARNRTPSIREGDAMSARLVTNDVRAAEAWKLLDFMTTKSAQPVTVTKEVAGSKQVLESNFDAAKNYLEKTRRPAARRDLIEQQKTDTRLGVFAEGNLIAKSWYQKDSDAIEGLFAQMIEKVNKGESTVKDAIDFAAGNIGLMMRQ